jgi:hypothetical protein
MNATWPTDSPSVSAAIILPPCPSVPIPKSPPTCGAGASSSSAAKGEYLGSVEAPDRERAEAVAAKLFDLDQDQRSRLLIRERP